MSNEEEKLGQSLPLGDDTPHDSEIEGEQYEGDKITEIIPVKDAVLSEVEWAGDLKSKEETARPPEQQVVKISRIKGTHERLNKAFGDFHGDTWVELS